MTEKNFPALGVTYYEERLANGLLVRVLPKKDFAKRFALLAADFGSMDMKFSLNGEDYQVPAGIAHYLEHKLFDMPNGSAVDDFARFGGSNNAMTNYVATAYYVECTECFEDNLNTLLDMVTTPWFTAESVEKEQGIIAQEINMYEDSAEAVVFEQLYAAMYKNHPVRVPIAGSVASIREITAESLYACHKAFYDPANLMLCVMGDVDVQAVMDAAAAHSPAGTGYVPVRDYGGEEPVTPAVQRVSRQMEVAMPTFAIGFKCRPADTAWERARQELIGELAAEVLAGESSPLYQDLYERNIIDGDFSLGYEDMKGMCLLEAGGDSHEPETVLQALLDEAARIAREGVDRAQFARLKKSMLGRRLRSLDSFAGTCFRMVSCHFAGTEYFDYPALFQAVGEEDVERFLRENVIADRAAISLILPKGDTRYGNQDEQEGTV